MFWTIVEGVPRLPAWWPGRTKRSVRSLSTPTEEADETAACVNGRTDRGDPSRTESRPCDSSGSPVRSVTSCERIPKLGNHTSIAGGTCRNRQFRPSASTDEYPVKSVNAWFTKTMGLPALSRIGDDDAGGAGQACRSVVDRTAGNPLAGRDRRHGIRSSGHAPVGCHTALSQRRNASLVRHCTQ